MSSHRSFRRLASATLAAATLILASACGGGGAEAEKFEGTVKIGVFPSFNANSAYAAEAIGAFEEQGLKVEFETIATPADAAPQLIGNKLQFALMDMTTPIVAASQGTRFTMVAPAAIGTPLDDDTWGSANVWVSPKSDIKSIKDLPGHKFGVPAINSQIWLDIRTAIDAAGGDSSKVDWVETGRTGVDQVKSGAVDATTTAEPAGTALANDPKVRHLTGFVSAGGHMSYVFVSTEQFAKANPELLKKFETAIIAGNKAFNADTVDAKAVVAQKALPDAPLALIKAARFPQYSEVPVSVDEITFAIERMEKYGMLEGGKAPEPDSFLPAK